MYYCSYSQFLHSSKKGQAWGVLKSLIAFACGSEGLSHLVSHKFFRGSVWETSCVSLRKWFHTGHHSPYRPSAACRCHFFTAMSETMCVFLLSSSLQKRVDQHHFPPLESCKLILLLSVAHVYIPHCFYVCLIKQKEVEREKQQHSLSTLFT